MKEKYKEIQEDFKSLNIKEKTDIIGDWTGTIFGIILFLIFIGVIFQFSPAIFAWFSIWNILKWIILIGISLTFIGVILSKIFPSLLDESNEVEDNYNEKVEKLKISNKGMFKKEI